MDEKAEEQFRNFSPWLDLFSHPNPNFEQFTHIPEMEEFLNNNSEAVGRLVKAHGAIHKLTDGFLKPEHDEIIQNLQEIDIEKLTQKIAMREKNQEEIYKDISQSIGGKVDLFEERVRLLSELLSRS